MDLTGDNLANTANVVTTVDHDGVTNSELVMLNGLTSSKVDLDGIVGLNLGVDITDGATVVSDGLGNTVLAKGNRLNSAELELK